MLKHGFSPELQIRSICADNYSPFHHFAYIYLSAISRSTLHLLNISVKMLSQPFALLAGAATLALAATPSGFQPGSDTQLFVEFADIRALNGAVVSKDASSSAPSIGTESQLTGTSYTIIMVDLDIPTNTTQTDTLLHWMQTGLTPATTATTLNTDEIYLLTTPPVDAAALAPYIGPNPPARNPLSHRYTQILVDTSELSTDAAGVLASAAQTRRGFNALSVLTQAGLEGKVVAGNYFNVTNPAGTTTGGTFPNATTTGGGSASGTGSVPTVSATPPVAPSGGMVVGLPGFALLVLCSVWGVFMAL